jgi:hypothetical protein
MSPMMAPSNPPYGRYPKEAHASLPKQCPLPLVGIVYTRYCHLVIRDAPYILSLACDEFGINLVSYR